MADLDRVQRLVEQALDDFDSTGQSLSGLLRRCMRIAKLRGDYANLAWMEMEATDVNPKGDHSAWVAAATEAKANLPAEEFNRVGTDAVLGYIGRRSTEGGSYTPSIEAIERNISKVRAAGAGMSSGGTTAALQFSVELETAVKPLEDVLSRVRAKLFGWLTSTERELQFGQVNASIFDNTRRLVDEQLRVIAPSALEMFIAAQKRLQEGDSEALSHALTSCRRVLKAVADAIYPATNAVITGEDGKDRKMSDDLYLNRINQALRESGHDQGRANELLLTTLAGLGPQLSALNNLTSQGVHADVKVEAVEFCLVQTYLAMGQVLRLFEGAAGDR